MVLKKAIIDLLLLHLLNSNYSLFMKLPWPGDSYGTLRFSSHAATCPNCLPHTVEASHCPFSLLNVQQESLEYQVLSLLFLGLFSF